VGKVRLVHPVADTGADAPNGNVVELRNVRTARGHDVLLTARDDVSPELESLCRKAGVYLSELPISEPELDRKLHHAKAYRTITEAQAAELRSGLSAKNLLEPRV
jgi:hypothetical protein